MNDGKPWWQSKLLWLGTAELGLAFTTGFTDLLQEYPDVPSWLLGALGALTILLRAVTSKPLTK